MTTRLRNRKNYHQWVLDHKDEILALPNKQRTDWVLTKINDELNLEMKRYNVYQLLYRNGLIDHKNDKITVYELLEKFKISPPQDFAPAKRLFGIFKFLFLDHQKYVIEYIFGSQRY